MPTPHFATPQELFDLFRTVFNGLPKGIIFDCDGVIVDSFASNIRFYNAVREILYLPPMDATQAKYAHMGTVQQALEHIVPRPFHAQIPELKAKATQLTQHLDTITPMPHLRPFLFACKAHGIEIGICTNRMNGMDDLLHECEMQDMFNPVITVAHAPAKPDPCGTCMILAQWALKAKDVLFIGDSETDRDAAKGAHVPFLAFGSLDLMDSAIAATDSFADLLHVFDELWKA